jgi:hypothetical protein
MVVFHGVDRLAFQPRAAQPVYLHRQRRHPLVVGQLAFAVQQQAVAKAPGQRRFGARHLRPRPACAPVRAHGLGQLVLQEAGEMRQRTLVGRMRHDQRALPAEIHRQAFCIGQLGNPLRPQLHGALAQREHGVVRHRQLGQRRQHGRRRHRRRGHVAAAARIEQAHAAAGAQQAPGQRAAGQARARDADVQSAHVRIDNSGEPSP